MRDHKEQMTEASPIPQNYLGIHQLLGTWRDSAWPERLESVMSDRETRAAYD